jgi:DNA-binding SARP family transcriptional activator
MATLRFQLFGKFCAQRDTQLLKRFDASKDQELLGYLLVHRNRSHPRETLAGMFWGESSTEKSKKYLRQSLWHLQTTLEVDSEARAPFLLVDHDWVQLNPQSEFWLDVATFEAAFNLTEGMPGSQLSADVADLLKKAVELYKGDLLEGCYEDWCLFERERLENLYLSMLDKLMSYCERHGAYEAGLSYGTTILSYDRAREHTHRQLMNLRYLAGDRTGALRQYERCCQNLKEELGVKPERRTVALYEQIRADRPVGTNQRSNRYASIPATSLPEMLGRLRRLQLVLAAVQKRIHRDIEAVEVSLDEQKR